MASKEVAERRLRPIYDLIDNMNNKKALQEIDKLLKKQPQFQTAKALKGLIFIRMEKFEDAKALLDKIMEEEIEETSLQALTMCFRETNRTEMICQVYEKVLKKDPTNEEYLTNLFMAYVRIGDYKSQQRVAMALYKCKPKNPYYFWAVMSVVMQAISGDRKMALGITYPLAERMVRKAIDENRMEAEPEVLLYLMILELQEKHSEIVSALYSPLGEKLLHESAPQLKAEAYMKIAASDPSAAQKAFDLFRDLARSLPDRFDYCEGMLNAYVILQKAGLVSEVGVDSLAKFMDEIRPEEKMRGPYLAKLLLVKTLGYEGTDRLSWFLEYCQTFGDKPCAFSDLKPFIVYLNADEQRQLLEETEKMIQLDGVPTSVSQLFRHLLFLQLERFLGRHKEPPVAEREKIVKNLCVFYEKTQEISGKSAQRELKPNDVYLVIAAHLLYDLWVESGYKEEYLLRALSLLHYGLEVSPANHHFKLLLVKFYALLGCGSGARDIYDSLDVKYVQLDSLSHILSHQLLPLGQIRSANAIYAQTLRFFSANTRESSEHVISCYKYGTFSKIPEMAEFRKRLEDSIQFSMATTENILLNLAFNAHTNAQVIQTAHETDADPDLDRCDTDTLIDNRDLTAMISYDNVSQDAISKIQSDTFKAERDYLSLRNKLLHLIVAALALSHDWPPEKNHVANGTPNGVESKDGVINRLRAELEHKLRELKEDKAERSEFHLQGPFRPRLYEITSRGYVDCVVKFVQCVQSLSDFEEANAVNTMELCVKELCEILDGFKNQKPDAVIQYDLKEKMYFESEVVCIATSLAGVCSSLLKAQKTKKTKKKKEEANQHAERLATAVASFNSVCNKLQETTESLLDQLQNWETARNEAKMADLASIVTLDGSSDITKVCRSKVWDGLLKNGVEEWKVCLSEKVKVLKTFVL